MNTAVPRERMAEVLDQVMRDITWQTAGIELQPSSDGPEEPLCTVYIAFVKDFQTSLSLCAETSLFTRLAQCMMMTDQVLPEDVEAVAMEYFNVLCGHIAARLFPDTRVAARFTVPAFYPGLYAPEGYAEQVVLTYSSDGIGRARLACHVPCGA